MNAAMPVRVTEPARELMQVRREAAERADRLLVAALPRPRRERRYHVETGVRVNSVERFPGRGTFHGAGGGLVHTDDPKLRLKHPHASSPKPKVWQLSVRLVCPEAGFR